MSQRWRIRVSGKQRREIDKGLLVQALLELMRQFEAEARAASPKPAAGSGEAAAPSFDEKDPGGTHV